MLFRRFVITTALFSALVSCATMGNAEQNAIMPLERLQARQSGKPLTPLPAAFSAQATKGIAEDQLAMCLAGVVDSGEGQSWCVAASGLPPYAVNQQLLAALQHEVEQ